MAKGKKIIIRMLVFMLVVGIGGYGVYEFYVKPKYLFPMINEMENLLADEENLSSIAKALEEEVQEIEPPEDIPTPSVVVPEEQKENSKESDIKEVPVSADISVADKEKEEAKVIEDTEQQIIKQQAVSHNTSQNTLEEKVVANKDEPKLNSEPVEKKSTENKMGESKLTESQLTEEQPAGESSISIADVIPIKSVAGKDVKELEEQVDTKDKMDGLKLLAKLDLSYLIGLAKNGVTDEEKEQVKNHMKERLTEEEYEKAKVLIYKYMGLLK